MPGQLFRRALGDDPATVGAAFRAEIHNPVRCLDHVQVMLNDHNGVTVVAQAMQDFKQLLNIMEMQTGRGFIKDIQCLAGIAF